MRVGIYPSSIDQVRLAREACREKNVELVKVNYMNLMTAMQRGQIDATVWNGDDFYASSYPFKAVPLLQQAQDLVQTQENTEAVIAVEKGNQLALRTLRSIVDKELVRDIQTQVMENKRIPIY